MLNRTGDTLHRVAAEAAGMDAGLGIGIEYSSSGDTHVGAAISNPRNRDASLAKRGGSSVTQHFSVPPPPHGGAAGSLKLVDGFSDTSPAASASGAAAGPFCACNSSLFRSRRATSWAHCS